MSVQSSFPLSRPRWDTEYALSLCGVAGMYALAGTMFPMATPVVAAAYGVISTWSARAILWLLDKWPHPTELTHKVASFASAFFAGALFSAFLINVSGLSMPFGTAMLLNITVVSGILTVSFVGLPCILCFGAAVGVRLLPSPSL